MFGFGKKKKREKSVDDAVQDYSKVYGETISINPDNLDQHQTYPILTGEERARLDEFRQLQAQRARAQAYDPRQQLASDIQATLQKRMTKMAVSAGDWQVQYGTVDNSVPSPAPEPTVIEKLECVVVRWCHD